ncbi:MAG: glycerophosphodiester phosphodiesterase [Candidatus Eremiobacterota bacterium]
MRTPIIIGHRGASGYLPQHTLEAYALAARQGADIIEPDIVSSRDGVLISRHENELSLTTDVASRPEFADRRTTRRIDGQDVTGWFTEDFTLAELKSLNVTGGGKIATLEEILDLVQDLSRETGRVIGIEPETKHPSHFDSLGLSLEEPLVEALHRRGYRGPDAPVFIQSFEVGNLRELNRMTDLRLVQLVDTEGAPADGGKPYAEMVTPAGLAEVATYADAVAPCKDMIVSPTGVPTTLVADAHQQGLLVHSWTFRAENEHLPEPLRRPGPLGDLTSEVRRFLDVGVDGIFANHPDLAVAARDAYLQAR